MKSIRFLCHLRIFRINSLRTTRFRQKINEGTFRHCEELKCAPCILQNLNSSSPIATKRMTSLMKEIARSDPMTPRGISPPPPCSFMAAFS